MKQRLRHVVDRVAMPYVDELTRRFSQVSARTGGDLPPTFTQTHDTLHEARTIALMDMPRGAKTVLSAGASGTWYFDWVDSSYGHVERHIAVEMFTQRPEVLPENVEWLQADIAAIGGVEAVEPESVDLIFSGQNIEHLWPEQVVSFLQESNRLLRKGGWLVVDSPNRALTALYDWSMPEHTVEFTTGEAVELFEHAGFEVKTMKGLWLGRLGGELLPLDPANDPGGAASVMRRMALATTRPEDSFIWWVEAQRGADPDIAALRQFVQDVFEANWRERINRFQAVSSPQVDEGSGSRTARMAKGNKGLVLWGPAMALPAGTFKFEIPVRWQGKRSGVTDLGELQVVAADEVLATSLIRSGKETNGSGRIEATFTLPDTRFSIAVRVISNGAADIEVPFELSLSPRPW